VIAEEPAAQPNARKNQDDHGASLGSLDGSLMHLPVYGHAVCHSGPLREQSGDASLEVKDGVHGE
jgi:hypothetical protein